MKKIKFLILALLGITIVPTVANADYEIFDSFNGNQGLLYTPYHGSILYRCPFSDNIQLKEGWNSTNSNSCFASKDYNYWWANTKDDTIPRPYYNGTNVQLITAIKKKDNTYSPFVLNFKKKSGLFEIGTKKYVDYISTIFQNGFTEEYSSILRGPDGYGQVIGGVFLDGLIIHSYTRSVDYTDYSNIILYDVSSGYGYYMELGVPLSQNLDTSFFSLIEAIYNYNGPIKCMDMKTDYINRTSLSDLSLDSNFSEINCPEINFKEKIKNQVYFFPEILDFYLKNSNNSLTSPLFVSTPQVDTGSNSSLAEDYKKCVSYYSDIKNLAYYSKSCGDDPVDDETLNRVKVDSWNAETEAQMIIDQLTGANKNKCGRFANVKKQYKDKYGAEFEKFYKEFGKYARTPEAVDIQSLCKGIELEHSAPPYIGYSSGNLSSWKDFFSSLFSGKGLKTWLDEEDEKIMYSSGNVVYTIGSYKTDLSQLEALYNQCYNKIYSESSEDVRIKTSYCNLYNSEKRRLSQKYASIDFASFGLVPFDARISQREAVANSGYLITYYNSVSSGFSSSLSEVGSKLFGFVQTPFLDGFDHGKFLSCQDSFSVPQFEIFAYIFFALIVFYLLKYL